MFIYPAVTIFLSGRELVSNSHKPYVVLYFSPSTKTCPSLYLNFDHPILKEPSVSSWYTPQVGPYDNLRLSTLWIYFACITDICFWFWLYRFSFNHRHWANYTFAFPFGLKTGFTFRSPHVSTIGIEMGSPFHFPVSDTGPDTDELASTYYKYDH